MKREYDYILIDSRTGTSDTSGTCTLVMPDVVVLCFGASDQNIMNTAGVARDIRNRTKPGRYIRILPVPSRIDFADNAAARKAKTLYEQQFAEFVRQPAVASTTRYWNRATIPYDLRYAYAEAPPRLADGSGDSVLRACEFLAQNISENDAVRLNPEDSAAWSRFVAGFERDPIELNYTRVIISHAPEDETWAEWIDWLLREHGIDVRLHRAERLNRRILDEQLALVDGERTDSDRGLCLMPLLSDGYVRLEHAKEAWSWAEGRLTPKGREILFPVRIGRFTPISPFTDARPVDLVGKDSEAARTSLLAALADELVNQTETVPGPLFPDESTDFFRLIEKRKSTLRKQSGERVTDLLERARRGWARPEQAILDLREARRYARQRGDVLMQARLAFVLAAADDNSIDSWCDEGVQATFCLAELDLLHVVPDPQRPLRSLSNSDEFRDDLQKLAAAMDTSALGAIRESTPELILADAIVSRLVGDYREARQSCMRARFGGRPRSPLEMRCDLELAVGRLLAGSGAAEPGQLERAFEKAARSQDPAVRFLGQIYLGLLEELGGRFDAAAAHYADALAGVPIDLNPSPWERHRRMTALLCLAEISEQPVPGATGVKGPVVRFLETARLEAEQLWPLTSFPLARTLERCCADDMPGSRSQKYVWALRCLWIYNALGLRDRMVDCRVLARKNQPENIADRRRLLEGAAIPDDDVVLEYLTRANGGGSG
jgi:hypothetical protein